MAHLCLKIKKTIFDLIQLPIDKTSITFKEFDESTESWEDYVKRLEQYFILNYIDSDKKVTAILSSMGAKTYSVLQNLVMPAAPENKDFGEIVVVLSSHFNPLPNKITERIKFRKRLQQEGESLRDFSLELKKLTKYCDFSSNELEANLLEQFLRGIRSEAIQQKLLLRIAELEFDKALSLAEMMENTSEDVDRLSENVPLAPKTGSTQLRPIKASNTIEQNTSRTRSCYRCGGKSHLSYECDFKDEDCYKCGKTGHIRKQCLIWHNYIRHFKKPIYLSDDSD